MSGTIKQVQSDIASALEQINRFASELPDELKPLLKLAAPSGTHATVSLQHHKKGKRNRQMKSDAPSHKWLPDSGAVVISYKPEAHPSSPATVQPASPATGAKRNGPEIFRILEPCDPADTFMPVEISGAPLSETILRQRR